VSAAANRTIIIALDAEGGDHGPSTIIAGAEQARIRYPDVRFQLFGRPEKIAAALTPFPGLKQIAEICPSTTVISAHEKPSLAIRQSKTSSMGLAIQAVKDGTAHGIVSAGNTGALMAMAKIALRTLPGIDRPAIASLLPTQAGDVVMLDLGANTVCNANNLFEFAVMGEAFARAVLGIATPRIGLLNIGSEDGKGHEEVKAAAELLKNCTLPMSFTGFVEGNDITKGVVDVVVTDGFTGNVALKSIEGIGELCARFIKDAFHSSIFAKIGFFLAKPALTMLFSRINPQQYNGAMLLGLNGIVVKSHGRADAFGFANAIGVAHNLASYGVNEKITADVKQYHESTAAVK
jgi:glycerol-3-phosphate acyltransferase PlsX